MATHVRFNIRCTAYETVEYVLDEELANEDNIWNKIKEYEYGTSVDPDYKLDTEALIKRTSTSTDGTVTTTTYRGMPDKTITVTKYLYVFGILFSKSAGILISESLMFIFSLLMQLLSY